MTKVIIRVKNGDSRIFETKGILDEKRNILTYDDCDGIRNILNFEQGILNRKNNGTSVILNFNSKDNPYIKICDENVKEELIIPIKLIKLKRKDKFLNIIYFVNDFEKIEFQIEILKFY